jgi:hypothetical protein
VHKDDCMNIEISQPYKMDDAHELPTLRYSAALPSPPHPLLLLLPTRPP